MDDFAWLPPLITLSDHSGDKIFYTEKLYSVFKNDLVENGNLLLFGKPVKVSSKLENDGRHERFWHIITDPHSPSMSDIKLPRAERISWIKPIIENIDNNRVLVYERRKEGDDRLHIFLPEVSYIVILSKKRAAYYFVTAYFIEYTYKLEEYKRECEKYTIKTKTAP